MIYIGKAKIFDDGITFRTVNYNYTYRMTDFVVANKVDPLSAGVGGCYSVNADDTSVDGTVSEESRYKLIYIDDVRNLYKSSAIDNTNWGG